VGVIGPVRNVQQVRNVRHKYGVAALVRGLFLRRHFTKATAVVSFPGGPLPRIHNRGRLEADVCILFPGVRIEVGRAANLRIGKGTYLNRDSVVVCQERIDIGRECRISYRVIIMDTDEHDVPGSPRCTGSVTIEDGVWIGAGAIILKGVRIGAGAIVGAGSVVTRDVAPRTVVGGNPARVIREF
jgi:acetyltransferase-like isoleucine patch superfamily enzyme